MIETPISYFNWCSDKGKTKIYFADDRSTVIKMADKGFRVVVV